MAEGSLEIHKYDVLDCGIESMPKRYPKEDKLVQNLRKFCEAHGTPPLAWIIMWKHNLGFKHHKLLLKKRTHEKKRKKR